MLSIHLYFACKALACAFAGDKFGDKAGNNRTLKQFSYSRLILDLSLPILCEASLTALGWDVGLLGQRSYSNTKRRMSIVLQFLRAINNERASKCKKDYEYLTVNANDYYLHLDYLRDKKKPSSN